MNILIVEDDSKIAQSVAEGLEAEGFSVTVVTRGEEGFYESLSGNFDLLILDWMLPGRSGVEVLRSLREKGMSAPVLMLTAKDSVEDRVEGLDAGADDYLVKPFAFAELLARVRALIRRGGSGGELLRYRFEDLEVDLVSRQVERGRAKIDMTAKEFELLAYLMRHQKQIVSREMLAKFIWPGQIHNASLNNVIDVHIGKVRKKIDAGHASKLIHTVRSLGFVLKSEAN